MKIWRTCKKIATASVALVCALSLAACSGASEGATGAAFVVSNKITTAEYTASAATGDNNVAIDTSHVNEGYVGAAGTSTSRLKLQVVMGEASYNYDLPEDGSSIIAPLTFGNGTYTFRIMQNTSGSNYIELYSTSASVSMPDENAPYVRPNVYCNFSEDSQCVVLARQLVENATNVGEAVEAICNFVIENISYDDTKASELKTTTGYVPNPDETLSSGTGICFDFASLGAAMLRSQGIPTRIVTGYVSPDDIYHAWIMVYINGSWQTGQFSVDQNTWSRIDLTFAASSNNANVGDGKDYTDRYVY